MHLRKTAAVMMVAAALPILTVGSAHAQDERMFGTTLQSLNDSGAGGTVTASWDGTELTVEMTVTDVLAGAPHAQHIHLVDTGDGSCPSMADDSNSDGVLSTTEGAPSYGPVAVALTVDGDTTPASTLAVDRMPSGDADGGYTYSRTFAISDEVAERLGEGVIVVHGVDLDQSGVYDGDLVSDLDPNLPMEATAPAACGALAAMPSGGVDTGAGTTGGVESKGLFGLAGILLLTAVGLAAYRRRPAVEG